MRSLERAIGGVVRFKAVEWAEWIDADAGTAASALSSAPSSSISTGNDTSLVRSDPTKSPQKYKPTVEVSELEKILGIARWDEETNGDREPRRGVVYGLVVTGMGEGEILPVESIAVPGTGKLKLTGSLGNVRTQPLSFFQLFIASHMAILMYSIFLTMQVIKESGELALSWVKTHAYELGVTASRGQDPLLARLGTGEEASSKIDIHLHLPAGAQKKDGPSAGIAMVCVLSSCFTLTSQM